MLQLPSQKGAIFSGSGCFLPNILSILREKPCPNAIGVQHENFTPPSEGTPYTMAKSAGHRFGRYCNRLILMCVFIKTHFHTEFCVFYAHFPPDFWCKKHIFPKTPARNEVYFGEFIESTNSSTPCRKNSGS